MRTLILLLLCFVVCASRAASIYTDFYCNASASAGTNVNAGSTTDATAVYTHTNGNWDGTSIYTPVDGRTTSSFVSAGMWASVCLDAATNTVYIAQVASVAAGANGAITLSTAAKSGTAPGNAATGNSIRVGGCWSGPHHGTGFPLNFIGSTATNNATSFPCVNFINSATYSVTAAITTASNGPVYFCGYSTTPRDGGKATIDGGTSVSGYNLLTVSGANLMWDSFIFSNDGNSGASASLLTCSGGGNLFHRIVFHDSRTYGLTASGDGTIVSECEAYACNSGSLASGAGMYCSGHGSFFINCISHDNVNAATSGFRAGNGGIVFVNCIAYGNGRDGFLASSSTQNGIMLLNCDAYNNTTNGLEFTGTTLASWVYAKNCNWIKNGKAGITNNTDGLRIGWILNNGFATGSTANGSGDIMNLTSVTEVGTVTYGSGATPWVDPVNTNFLVSSTSAKSSGRGLFTQGGTSPATTVSYPDIGAAQAADTNAASATVGGSYSFGQ